MGDYQTDIYLLNRKTCKPGIKGIKGVKGIWGKTGKTCKTGIWVILETDN